MDRQRHRLLTENVSYLQKCLTVTRELLKTCVYQGVLREEEQQTIWDEESLDGKSLELIYILRKKDDVIYDKFVEILKQKRGSQDRLVGILSKKRMATAKHASGITTENLLLEALVGKVEEELIVSLAVAIEEKEIFKVKESQLEMQTLKQELEITRDSAKHLNKRFKEQENVIEMYRTDYEEKEKEVETIKRQFNRLNAAREKQSQELQAHRHINEQYHIALQSISHRSDEDTGHIEYDEDIKKAEEMIKNLNTEMAKVQLDLETKDAELKTLKDGIERIRKVVLPNNTDATLDEIEEEIKNNTTKKFLSVKKDELLKEIERIRKKKNNLRKSIEELEREKILIKSELRTAEAKTTRMRGLRKYEESFLPKRDRIASATALPQGFQQSIRKGRDPRESLSVPLSTARAKTAKARSKTPTKVYCLLCRNTVGVSNPGPCFIHKYGLNDDKWSCCSRRWDGKGCYLAKHCYFAVGRESRDAISTIDRTQSIAFH